MTHKEIVEQINAVLQAMNNISVRGKQNLTNLVGCIQVLENIATQLEVDETTKK